jgi:hypothetical protein
MARVGNCLRWVARRAGSLPKQSLTPWRGLFARVVQLRVANSNQEAAAV